MRGDNHVLAVTTRTVTHEDDPLIPEGETREVPVWTLPIQVAKASSDAEEKLDRAAPSGSTYTVKYLDDATGEIHNADELLHGKRIADQFYTIPDDQLQEIAERTQVKTMVVRGRVDLDVAFRQYGPRITGFYYLQSPPTGGSPTAYRLLYEILREQRKGKKVTRPAQALVTKRTPRARQQQGFIYADEDHGCLAFVALKFAAQVREPDATVKSPVANAQLAEPMIEKAMRVLAAMPDGTEFLDHDVDEAIPLRAELIDKVISGEALAPLATPTATIVDQEDLEAQLAASIA